MKIAHRIAAAILLLGMLCPGLAWAAPARPDEYFTISDYTVDVAVSRDKVYDVRETIRVRFREPRHGIFRTLSLSGVQSIEDITVDGFPYDVTSDGGNMVIRIGDANAMVDGEQVYKIRYRMVYSTGAGSDEVRLPIIGTGWDTTIGSVSFSVSLPASFDAGKLDFSLGGKGYRGYHDGELKYTVDGNTIAGSVTRPLGNNEGLTMLLALPQGYFQATEFPEKDPGAAVEIDALAPEAIPDAMTGSPGAGVSPVILLFAGFGVIVVIAIVVRVVRRNGQGTGGRSDMADSYAAAMLVTHRDQAMQDTSAINAQVFTDAGGGTTGVDASSGGGAGGGGGSW